jgi:hypothetical protein
MVIENPSEKTLAEKILKVFEIIKEVLKKANCLKRQDVKLLA